MVVFGKQLITSRCTLVKMGDSVHGEDKWQDNAENNRRLLCRLKVHSENCIVSPSAEMQTAAEISQ